MKTHLWTAGRWIALAGIFVAIGALMVVGSGRNRGTKAYGWRIALWGLAVSLMSGGALFVSQAQAGKKPPAKVNAVDGDEASKEEPRKMCYKTLPVPDCYKPMPPPEDDPEAEPEEVTPPEPPPKCYAPMPTCYEPMPPDPPPPPEVRPTCYEAMPDPPPPPPEIPTCYAPMPPPDEGK